MAAEQALRVLRLAVRGGVHAALRHTPSGGSPLLHALRDVISQAWYRYISGQRRVAFGLLLDDLCGDGKGRARERAYQNAIEASCCWYPHTELVVACEWPQQIYIELQTPEDRPPHEGLARLHRTDGAAMSWPDGWGVHAVHGLHEADRGPAEPPDS
jgi:hypothetical protein